jgi:hypothetical protein
MKRCLREVSAIHVMKPQAGYMPFARGANATAISNADSLDDRKLSKPRPILALGHGHVCYLSPAARLFANSLTLIDRLLTTGGL